MEGRLGVPGAELPQHGVVSKDNSGLMTGDG